MEPRKSWLVGGHHANYRVKPCFRCSMRKPWANCRPLADMIQQIIPSPSIVIGSMSPFGYGSIPINTIFRGMNVHLLAILMFTRGIGFWGTYWGNKHSLTSYFRVPFGSQGFEWFWGIAIWLGWTTYECRLLNPVSTRFLSKPQDLQLGCILQGAPFRSASSFRITLWPMIFKCLSGWWYTYPPDPATTCGAR